MGFFHALAVRFLRPRPSGVCALPSVRVQAPAPCVAVAALRVELARANRAVQAALLDPSKTADDLEAAIARQKSLCLCFEEALGRIES